MKKEYTVPKVLVVNLDNKQALIQTCKVGGMYFSTTQKCLYFTPPGGAPAEVDCPLAVKGSANSMFNLANEVQNMAS